MPLLAVRAYLRLIYVDLCLMGGFSALYDRVRGYPISEVAPSDASIEEVCAAVDMACIWYWKEVPCLQRSVVAALLLRAHGVPARMVIGVQQMPFRAHAWVEVEGRVVNDKAYMREMYAVLDCC